MEMTKITAKVISQEIIATGVYNLIFQSKEIAENSRPGQFVSVYCKDGSKLLPRPISICNIDKEKGQIRLVYRVAGQGTLEFSKLQSEDTIEVMGPLGNGFPLSSKKAIVIGGGIGIPPMLQVAKSLNCDKTIVLGYRDELFLNEEFQQYGQVVIASEDGKNGIKGNVLDAIKELGVTGQVIYACGPTPMLRAIKEYGIANNIETYISLEEKMACGIGACLACVCKSKEKDSHSNVNNKRICKDGPVFLAEEVEI